MADKLENRDGTIRSLSNRHVQMIAIGGTIGTGLFLGAGTTISATGPSVVFIYAIMGIFFFFLLRALGEMFYYDYNNHTFVSFITRYLGDGFGHFAGWTYWIGLLFSCMAELSAVSTYVQFWLPNIPAWLIQVVALVLLTTLNLTAAMLFGETEFWFAMIKITAIIALIVTGIIMVAVNAKTPVGHASLRNFTYRFALMPKGPYAFFTAFPMVFFSFAGIEFVTITIGEAKDPQHVIKKAVNETLLRILLFYIATLVVIMCVIPWWTISASSSPFVQVFQIAGFNAVASVFNFIVLTAAASALNSCIFSSGRHLFQLAEEAQKGSFLKKHFAKISPNGVPARGLLISVCFVLIAPALSFSSAAIEVFSKVAGATSDMFILVYVLALLAHRKYRQSSDFMEDGFKMPLYQVASPLTILFFLIIFFSLFFIPNDVFGATLSVLWTLFFGSWCWFRERRKKVNS
ncbi:MAG: amino acid permease [Lacticaseibacillus absianus]